MAHRFRKIFYLHLRRDLELLGSFWKTFCYLTMFVLAAALIGGPAQAKRLDLQRLQNRASGAVPIGIHFTMPLAHRRLIVEDLLWLSKITKLPDADQLSEIMDIKSAPLTGEIMVAWLLDRITIMTSSSQAPITLEISATDQKYSAAQHVKDGRFQPLLESALTEHKVFAFVRGFDWSWTTDKNNNGVLTFLYDSLIVIDKPSEPTQVPLIYLTQTLFDYYGTSSLPDRIMRLATYFHEAMHFSLSHTDCKGSLASTSFLVAGVGLGPVKEEYCDRGYYSAVGITAVIIHSLTSGCIECSNKELKRLIASEIEQLLKIKFKLKRPVKIAKSTELSETGDLTKDTFDYVPPRAILEALESYVRTIEMILYNDPADVGKGYNSFGGKINSRSELAAFGAWLRSLDEKHLIQDSATWSNGRLSSIERLHQAYDRIFTQPFLQKPDVASTRLWLQAVEHAEASGYNVPLASLLPCETMDGACAAGSKATASNPAPEMNTGSPYSTEIDYPARPRNLRDLIFRIRSADRDGNKLEALRLAEEQAELAEIAEVEATGRPGLVVASLRASIAVMAAGVATKVEMLANAQRAVHLAPDNRGYKLHLATALMLNGKIEQGAEIFLNNMGQTYVIADGFDAKEVDWNEQALNSLLFLRTIDSLKSEPTVQLVFDRLAPNAGSLNIETRTMSFKETSELGSKYRQSFLVTRSGSNAIKEGDLIWAVNGAPCNNLNAKLAVLGAGAPVKLSILRAGSDLEIEQTLSSFKAALPAASLPQKPVISPSKKPPADAPSKEPGCVPKDLSGFFPDQPVCPG